MILYLCKLDPSEIRLGEPKFVAVLGRIVGDDDSGFRFLPNVSGRKASRRAHRYFMDCIPRWTNDCGFTRLLDKREVEAAQRSA
jgi:hypothetical protein